MNPIAGTRETGANISAKGAEQPQYQDNDYDSPQHEISPFLTK
jgi:hypothetical protein